MKPKIILLASAALLNVSAFAQEKTTPEIPAAVMEAFEERFPKAEKITWEVEAAGEFEAEFKIKGPDQSARFNKEGKWLETETAIKISELPEPVKHALAKQFKGLKITEASKVESLQHGDCFEVELQKDKESMDVLLSPNGEVLNKETETGTKDDDK